MSNSLVKSDQPDAFRIGAEGVTYKTALIIGEHPQHKHACGHLCNSPYCEEVTNIPCQNCGGPPRVQRGLEPWRGR